MAVLHSWGKLRSWTLSGHFHETWMHDLIHVNEALSGLPVEVSFINFEDVKKGCLKDVDVVINAGYEGSAWSGGEAWADDEVVSLLTEWVYQGGSFIGVNEPSAVRGYDTFFRMAHVLGIDEDTGARVCHGRWKFEIEEKAALIPEGVTVKTKKNVYLTGEGTKVLLADGENPLLTVNECGKGKGIYLAGFEVNAVNTRLLYQLILYAGGEELDGLYMTDNLYTECAYYAKSRQLVVINNSEQEQKTSIRTEQGSKEVALKPFETIFMEL